MQKVTPRKRRDAATMRAIARRALERGYGEVVSTTLTKLRLSGNCPKPQHVVLWGRPNGEYEYVNVPEDGTPYGVELIVRCRKCDACRRYRSERHAHKVVLEAARCYRTWFGTLTFRPDRHSKLAHAFHLRSGSEVGYEVAAAQRYLKRLRKHVGKGVFRYTFVTEAHKSGLPHLHLLVHELKEGQLTKRLLDSHWHDGFSRWKLVPSDSGGDGFVARYMLKYVGKAGGRVRSSQHYGLPRHSSTKEAP